MTPRPATEMFPLAGTFAVVAAVGTLFALGAMSRAEWREQHRPRPAEPNPFVQRQQPTASLPLGAGALVLAVGGVLTGFPGFLANQRERADRRLAAVAGVFLVGAVVAWGSLAGLSMRRAAVWDPNDRPSELVVMPNP